jgi:DNA-binding response OmpR family regulator
MGSPSTILVVDDEANIRSLVRTCLEDAGYVVREARNGSEALEQVYRDAPDLMLLDLAMPVMDGMTVLAEMHTLWARYPTRVVVVTAHGSVKVAIQAIRLGASDFLEKPFVPTDLRLSVASVLREAPPDTYEAGESYSEVLEQVRKALRARRFDVAERELMKAGTITGEDPEFLNLAGVLHEAHGRVDTAKRFYQRSALKNGHYEPAEENLKRLDDLRYTGKTRRRVALNDNDVRHDLPDAVGERRSSNQHAMRA